MYDVLYLYIGYTFFFPYQQSEYKVFYELMCWLSGSLTLQTP
jgi:hypothetical protein